MSTFCRFVLSLFLVTAAQGYGRDQGYSAAGYPQQSGYSAYSITPSTNSYVGQSGLSYSVDALGRYSAQQNPYAAQTAYATAQAQATQQNPYATAQAQLGNYITPTNVQSSIYQPQSYGLNPQTTYGTADASQFQGYSQGYNSAQTAAQVPSSSYGGVQTYQSLGTGLSQQQVYKPAVDYSSYAGITPAVPTPVTANKGYNAYANYFQNLETATATGDADQRNLQKYSQYLDILQKHYGIRLPEETTGANTGVQYGVAPVSSQTAYGQAAAAQQSSYGQTALPVNMYGQSVIQSTATRPSTNAIVHPVAQPIVQPATQPRVQPVVQNVVQPYVDSREGDSSKYLNSQAGYAVNQVSSGLHGSGSIYSAGNVNLGTRQNISNSVGGQEENEYENSNQVVSATASASTPRTFLYTTQKPSTQSINSVQGKGDSQPMTTISALTQQIRRLPAVLYVDSTSPDAKRSEALLRETYGLPLVAFYVDKLDDSATVEKLLHQLTAHKGLPYLFICGTFIGSQQHIDNYHKNGQVPQLVEYVCGDEKKRRKKKTSS